MRRSHLPILLLAGLVLAPAALPPAAALLPSAIETFLPWGSPWAYCTTVHNGTCDTARLGAAPFGQNEGQHCGSPFIATTWPMDSDLLATTTFVVPPGFGRVHVHHMIDNGIEATFSGAVTGTVSDYRGNCDLYGDTWLPATPGVATVTVRAQDYGQTLALFAMSVTG